MVDYNRREFLKGSAAMLAGAMVPNMSTAARLQRRKEKLAGRRVIWEPQRGSQQAFLRCPVFETLYEGTRGPGKTDGLLMDFAQFVGRGFGPAWRGILFRETYPNLEDVIAKSQKWFPQLFKGCRYHGTNHVWIFKGGERLYFRHAAKPRDYWNYHGHEYPWIGWEELTNWPDDELYKMIMTLCRSSSPDMPRRYRATCNPYGVGHNWVKARFIDPVKRGRIMIDESGKQRVALHGDILENRILLNADPDYIQNLKLQGGVRAKAWLHGDWNITAGGMFDDLWDPCVHMVEPFDIPLGWKVDRSFDWGSSKPYSVGFWAESDGTDIIYSDGDRIPTVKGDLFRISEIYGWNGTPNHGTKEVATVVAGKVKKREKALGLRVLPGPADVSIWSEANDNCIAKDMASMGVRWERAKTGSHSRNNGWELMRRRLFDSVTGDGPGLFCFDTCPQFIRTVPGIRRDDKDMDDVDCLVAGTLIDTINGVRSIEKVCVGELVKTPIGWRRVTHSHVSGLSKTVKITLSNGKTLEGTPRHKIYVEGAGLVPLWCITEGLILTQKISKIGESFEKTLRRWLKERPNENLRALIVRCLLRQATGPQKLVVTSVVGCCEKKPVYNLTVEQAHLYYANGVLVTNTDAEDHIADEARYRALESRGEGGIVYLPGMS